MIRIEFITVKKTLEKKNPQPLSGRVPKIEVKKAKSNSGTFYLITLTKK